MRGLNNAAESESLETDINKINLNYWVNFCEDISQQPNQQILKRWTGYAGIYIYISKHLQ